MPRKAKVKESAPKMPSEPVGGTEPVEPIAAVAEPKEGEIAVIRTDGSVVRVYTKEVHGADYAKLAESFAEKNGLAVSK